MACCRTEVVRASTGAQAQGWHAQALAWTPCPVTVVQSQDAGQRHSGAQLQTWQVQLVFIGTSWVSGC
jgi:hypothetical protein